MIEYVAVRGILRGGSGGNVAIGFAVDVTVLKPSRGGAEDEIRGALYVASVKIKPRVGYACIDSVLIAQETAIDKHQLIPLSVERHGLSQPGGVVLYGDILYGDVTALHLQGISSESPHGLPCGGIDNIGMVTVGDEGFVPILAAYLNVSEPRGDNHLFLVYTFLHENDLVVIHEGATHFQSLVDRTELGRTVGRHKERVRIVILVSGMRQREGHEKHGQR